MDQGDGDGGDGGGEVIGDEASENVPEGVRGVGLALLQRVGLNVGVEAGASCCNALLKLVKKNDTDAHIQTASRSYTRALWYQSRVWDPDD